ncbi:hypothetical protein KVL93_01100 [Helicobacter pylori]|uniref:hypothetical protein n=1 Tax=Helicobacter pylori TaxID=210 RepID=UPI00046DFFFB|nr:hypothetical protein [Helicobacter pylori]RKV30846.1 hypothetical protein DD746_00675 [Helicobacter pylori]WQZ74877.1 hypothetical protein KVL93_01100 [Helicobacter pylori]
MFKSAFGAMVIAFIVFVIIAVIVGSIISGIWEGCRDFFSKPYVSIPIVLALIVSIIIHLVRAT